VLNEPFAVEGDLWLVCQEGGFACDSFTLKDENEQLPIGIELDDIVADYFGAGRILPSGDRHIGQVRITIERVDANAA